MAVSSGWGASGISALVERQMRNWELSREQTTKELKQGKTKEEKEILFYVTLSREAGCGADDIAEKIIERTGFQKFDHEIVDYMVGRDDVRRKLFETLDDRTIGWIEDVCSALMMGPAVDEVEYFNRLSHALLAICHNTHAIIVGRGSNFILPKKSGLSVRLVAPANYRLDKFSKRHGMDLKTAREEMMRIDKDRGQFIETNFGKYAYDPRRYDLTLNLAMFSIDDVADIIVTALKAKAGSKLKLPVKIKPGK